MYLRVNLDDIIASCDTDDLKQLIAKAQVRLDYVDCVELDDQEKEFVKKFKSIEALKSLRVRYNISLVDAKKAIDNYRAMLIEGD